MNEQLAGWVKRLFPKSIRFVPLFTLKRNGKDLVRISLLKWTVKWWGWQDPNLSTGIGERNLYLGCFEVRFYG